jgi:transposase
MSIDEKSFDGDFHTVLSNRDTGKIAMLARSVRAKELVNLLPKFDLKGFDVKSVTRDLSPSYDWFCRQAFCNSMHVADKFHIIKELMDCCQDVRVRYRQEILTDKRLKYDEFKKQEHLRKQRCRETKQQFVPQQFVYREQKASNGETFFQLLARSRYLLYKYSTDWTESQKQRAVALFKHFPEIEKAYKLACSFRTWYRKENIGRCKEELTKDLNWWYLQVEKAEVMEMENFKSLVQRHQAIILNYFVKGDTNAKAEAINSKIQRFIMINKGTRNIEFFYFRLEKLFA